MHVLIITPYLMQGAMLQNALKRKNLKSLCTLPNSLTFEWFPETDAVLIPHSLTPIQWSKVKAYLTNISPNIPLLVIGTLPISIYKESEELLKHLIKIDESIRLDDIPGLVKESIKNKYPSLKERELVVGDMKLNRNKREVEIYENIIFLTRKEFYLLELLMMNAGQIITRERIVEYVWDRRTYVAQNTIDVYISRLRRKIDKRVNKTFIKTVPCLGYQFEKMGTLQST